MLGIFSRIYLYLSKEYFLNFPDCDIDKLLEDFADCRVITRNGLNLFEENVSQDSLQKKYFMGRIKDLIIEEANDFIRNFEDVYSTESLGRYVSKRQIKSLVRAFQEKDGKITGYAFVIFHIIFKAVKTIPNYNFDNLKNCINAVNSVVEDYILHHPKDPIAYFLLQCFNVVSNEISRPDLKPADKNSFPAIPKRHNCDYDE